MEAAKAAISLVGNASAQITKEVWRKAIKGLNKEVHPLAEEEEILEEAALLLLGQIFKSKMKSHLESLKCLAANSQRDKDRQSFQRGYSNQCKSQYQRDFA